MVRLFQSKLGATRRGSPHDRRKGFGGQKNKCAFDLWVIFMKGGKSRKGVAVNGYGAFKFYGLVQ